MVTNIHVLDAEMFPVRTDICGTATIRRARTELIMKVVLLAVGSRGDVQPMVALGRELAGGS